VRDDRQLRESNQVRTAQDCGLSKCKYLINNTSKKLRPGVPGSSRSQSWPAPAAGLPFLSEPPGPRARPRPRPAPRRPPVLEEKVRFFVAVGRGGGGGGSMKPSALKKCRWRGRKGSYPGGRKGGGQRGVPIGRCAHQSRRPVLFGGSLKEPLRTR